MKKFLLLSCTIFVLSCSFPSFAPTWKDEAARHLNAYKSHFLSGSNVTAELYFSKTQNDLSSGNDVSGLAMLYLTKYALHAASLESFETSVFAKLYRLEPNAAHMSYCHFLKGNFTAVDVRALPPRYAGVLKAALGKDLSSVLREINAIDDPLSRLIACGVWVRYLPYDEAILQTSVATASANGWRRPLFAFLEKLQSYYLEHGDQNKAETIKLRLEILKKEG